MGEISIKNNFELTSQNDLYNLGTYFLVAERLLEDKLSENENRVWIKPNTKLVYEFRLDPKYPNIQLLPDQSLTDRVSDFIYVATDVNSILEVIYLSESITLDEIPTEIIEEVNAMLSEFIGNINEEEIIKRLKLHLTYKLRSNIRREIIQEIIRYFQTNNDETT